MTTFSQSSPCPCYALRRGVLQQHPRHLWPDGKDHPFQWQFLSVQLDRQRPVPAARCLCAPDWAACVWCRTPGSTGKSAAQLIADEKCSAALDDTGEATALRAVSYSDTTWALLFNSAEGSVFENQALRQALAGIAGKMQQCLFRPVHRRRGPCACRADCRRHRLPRHCRGSHACDPDPRALYLEARQGVASSDFPV